MGMSMATSTMSSMPSSTSGMSGMSGMGSSMDDMSGMMQMMDGQMMMPMSSMAMVFFTSYMTPLFSSAWMPDSVGQYAGTCIFLIALSAIFRLLFGLKSYAEFRWRRQLLRRARAPHPAPHRDSRNAGVTQTGSSTSVLVDDKPSHIPADVLSGHTQVGAQECSRDPVSGETCLPDPVSPFSTPFRLHVDLSRAALVTVMVGVGYLLMLAVMTMNVGYFLSVLGGAFLGELLFGRWSVHSSAPVH